MKFWTNYFLLSYRLKMLKIKAETFRNFIYLSLSGTVTQPLFHICLLLFLFGILSTENREIPHNIILYTII